MTLLTLFSAPKPFSDPHVALIQRNAIRSWTLLPEAEVLLLGEETGLAEAAKELGVRHIPHVARSANGTPLISSMFQLARENSNSPLLCIINADIILMSDFVEAAQRVMSLKDQFVMVSQRWDYDLASPLDFAEGWESRLREDVRKQNQLHRPAGSDFFLFPLAAFQEVPNFAIGRAGWDNWMIYKARREGWAVIDCTPSVMIVHQNHDYSHLPGGKPHYDHPETNENIRLAGGQANIRYTILDATHQLLNGTLARPKLTSARLLRKLELCLRTLFFFLPEPLLESIARPQRWKKRIRRLFKQR
ncbi:MAG: hypothetical protein ACOYYF_11690 [Chloroflexota bacterium]|nr:hypothetical protein [Chloroflexota bacterium]MBI5702376.1 hypothetical protein [Chloroflexota bacterium]